MITRDKTLICDILRQCEDGHEGSLTYETGERFLYLYCDGCLFPATVEGCDLSIHACVPKQKRGHIAIKAMKKVLKWALEKIKFRRVRCQIPKRLKNNASTRVFARLCGGKRFYEDEKYYFYEVRNG